MASSGGGGGDVVGKGRSLVGFGYLMQGLRCLPWMAVSFFLIHTLHAHPSTLQLLQTSVNLPMVAKPLYGVISDAVYIFGQHRIPYILLGGDKYVNGTIIPRPPPVQMWRTRGRYDDRNCRPIDSAPMQNPPQGDVRNSGPTQNFAQGPPQGDGRTMDLLKTMEGTMGHLHLRTLLKVHQLKEMEEITRHSTNTNHNKVLPQIQLLKMVVALEDSRITPLSRIMVRDQLDKWNVEMDTRQPILAMLMEEEMVTRESDKMQYHQVRGTSH